MSFRKVSGYLLQAQGKDQSTLFDDNPFKQIAFDGGKKRLGWLRVLPFRIIKKTIQKLLPILEGKEYFIFSGIGGSGNGIKVLLSLFKADNVFVLDSLDPQALIDILHKVKLDKTLVIPISKSGTTKETQYIALTLKELFGKKWAKHFLWLSDPQAFSKLDELGWKKSPRTSIQFDSQDDIGGRFSCPHTLIFYLPLFLLCNHDFKRLEQVYYAFTLKLEKIRREAYLFIEKCFDKPSAYFYPVISSKICDTFTPWVTQLIQESIGSKQKGLAVKTATFPTQKVKGFFKLKPGELPHGRISALMCHMYFYQVFTAYYAVVKNVNFVNQEYVETYKAQMRKLEGKKVTINSSLDTKKLIKGLAKLFTRDTKFIEVVLYFDAKPALVKQLRSKLKSSYPDKIPFVFIGSDWNHHSYQAAFDDKETVFAILLSDTYPKQIKGISSKTLAKNIASLKLIAKATHITIQDKAILAQFKR